MANYSAAAKAFDKRVMTREAEVSAGTPVDPSARALPGWVSSWVLEYALGVLLSYLKNLIKSEPAKATLKKVLKRVFDGIVAWYPDDEQFTNCPD